MPAHPWEWRLYDPATGRDTLFLRLRSFPFYIRWDSSFTSVQFVHGNKIARARWKLGEEAREVVRLPADSSICDFWSDAAGGWHVVTQREIEMCLPDGRHPVRYVGTRWDLPHSSTTWHAARVDSNAGGHYGECWVTPELQRDAPPPRMFRVGQVLDRMSLDSHEASVLSQDSLGPEFGEEWVWVASKTDSTQGLEMGAIYGESYHAVRPVVWVGRRQDRRKEVYSEGRGDSRQLAFEERDGKVLIVTEYDGGYPVVVDMRSGKILFRIDRPSARAVWVPAPE